MAVAWKVMADIAKKRPMVFRVADWLGRGRGRFRVFDRLRRPAHARHKPDMRRWLDHDLAAAWLGHATILLRIGGLTILTDPVFSNRIGLDLGLMTGGPMRRLAPALSIRELPPIDLILVSHAHFDHLDRPTLHRLPKRTPVIISEHNGDLVRDLGFAKVSELRWGESSRVGAVKVTARPVQHWGARTFHDGHRGFCAFLIEAGRRRVLFGADTALCDHFHDVGGVDLGIFGIGAYDPYIQAHASPEQVWTMANHAKAEMILPMHHSTFRLSHEPMAEPMERLLNVAGRDEGRIVLREVGQTWIR